MIFEVRLNYPWKFIWQRSGDFHVIGPSVEVIEQKLSHINEAMLPNELQKVKGNYAIVIHKEDSITAITDTAAAFPLFYCIDREKIIISDHLPQKAVPDNQKAIKAFQKIYCTEDSDTLLKAWKTIPAGHILKADESGYQLRKWFNHSSLTRSSSDKNTENRFIGICRQWAEYLQPFAENGYKIWVPLSGGYDSRLILCVLKKFLNTPIAAYTYGRKDSHEYEIAQKVSQELNIEWHFIPYEKTLFEIFNTDIWKDYAEKNHHFTSLPHEQDFFALYSLKQKGVLGNHFMVIPGYCGDISGGSFLKNRSILFEDYILEKHQYITQSKKNLQTDEWQNYQEWLCRNRLSKFIVNSVRAFEHFGGKWYLPMWEPDFLSMMYTLPFEERLEEKTYLQWAFKQFFEPMNVAFRKPSFDSSGENTLKNALKKIIPSNALKWYQKNNAKSIAADPCNLHVLYDIIYEKLQDNKIDKNYNINELHAIYCLKKWTENNS